MTDSRQPIHSHIILENTFDLYLYYILLTKSKQNQGWNGAMTYNLATYVGAGTIRDGLPPANSLPDFLRLVSAGVTLNVVVKGSGLKNKTDTRNMISV
jgi:hypothetical protein